MPEPVIYIIKDDSEADACRKYVLPKLKDDEFGGIDKYKRAIEELHKLL